MKELIKRIVAIGISVIVFVSSVLGIAQTFGFTLHFTDIYIPNPIIIIISIVVAALLFVAAFFLGSIYVLRVIVMGIASLLAPKSPEEQKRLREIVNQMPSMAKSKEPGV
ncbi:hypothetical protein KSD_59360 [Ktedonobacter sp. SOSP1-85]|uniref:hypothetical protein n=1 Tax=Ktedonobacter sp. SOSP1-85 TaxID=2778367 RepID=UPI001915E7D9|nr:hypothetical protein [Ktedonobacter sp. SOSP1-85]GHO78165.1 hypothetical protein KSD_59360 [Ktedonobacter sp. SOSP1-85]